MTPKSGLRCGQLHLPADLIKPAVGYEGGGYVVIGCGIVALLVGTDGRLSLPVVDRSRFGDRQLTRRDDLKLDLRLEPGSPSVRVADPHGHALRSEERRVGEE